MVDIVAVAKRVGREMLRSRRRGFRWGFRRGKIERRLVGGIFGESGWW